MTSQLVRQDDGSYDYEEVDTAKKSVTPNLTEFEAYEGAKKGGEDLVGALTLAEQTEKIQREIPSQVEFDAKTGTFVTKKAKTIDLEYKEPERTPESTEMTALEKVMSMPKQEQIDYSEIMKDAYQVTQPTIKDQLISSAIDVGGNLLTNYITKKITGAAGDIIINNMTRHVLGGTMSGSLAATTSGSTMTGTAMMNPYTMAAAALMTKPGQKVAKKAVKTIKKTFKKAKEKAKDVFGTVICTELYRQKLMSKEDCRLSWNFTINNFSSTHINGYWYWAVPITKIMKKNKLVTKFWNHIMSNRTKDIKWRLGKNKFNLLGRLYSILIENGSYIIGRLIEKKKIKEVLA
tara:strand:- start:474 stop:1517 length:1044 start_codon:yes stop_codon:yes gene_type:complete